MRIVVDLQACQSGSRLGGIGRYSMDLLKSMVAADRSNEFVIVLNDLFPQSGNEVRSALRNIIPASNIVAFPAPSGCASVTHNPALSRAAEVIRESFIASLNPDVVHVASLIEGFFEEVVTSIGRTEGTPPTGVTFYDLIPMMDRDGYLGSRPVRSHYFDKIRSLQRADLLLAISQYVADEGKRLLPDFRGNMRAIHGGIGPEFMAKKNNAFNLEVRRKFGLSKKFILYVASFDQRKNQAALIRAFGQMKDKRRQEYQLAFAGGGNEVIYGNLHAIARQAGLRNEDVKFLGRVNDQELVALYGMCALFAFPPLSEGLGMPPLEASACGAVVIGSNTSSVPEVIGWDEALFDPRSPGDIAKKMHRALFDNDFRAESRKRGMAQVELYKWEKSATSALDALAEISAKRSAGKNQTSCMDALIGSASCEDLVDQDLLATSKCAIEADWAGSENLTSPPPRIGWVSSWDARCGIADYSGHLVKHMRNKPIVLGSYRSDEDLKSDSTVVRCWQEGKSDFLIELEEAINAHGVDIVHIQFNYSFFEFPALNSFMLKLIASGKTVAITLHSTVDQFPEWHNRLDCLAATLKIVSRIFVHSPHDVARLAELGIRSNVTLIPLGLVQPPSEQVSPSSAVGKQHVSIATYGFALPGKGLAEMVDAMALLKAGERKFKLAMVNADYRDPHGMSSGVLKSIHDKIREHKLQDDVEVDSGYLSNEAVFEKLSRADIVVYPYTKTGESGSAAVRAGLAVPAIVATSPLPIFDDIKEAVYQLPGVTPKDIADGLTALANDMENNSEGLARIHAANRALVDVTSYREVAGFIERTLLKDHAFNVFTPTYTSSEQRVIVANGTWVNGVIVASKEGGLLCYGPYIDLDPGLYKITVDATMSPRSAEAVLEIMSEGQVIAHMEIMHVDGEIRSEHVFSAARDLNAVELLFRTPRNSGFKLREYKVYKRWR